MLNTSATIPPNPLKATSITNFKCGRVSLGFEEAQFLTESSCPKHQSKRELFRPVSFSVTSLSSLFTMNNYFTDRKIINQLCVERIKLAEKRGDRTYLPRLIGRGIPTIVRQEVDGMLPPRKQWNAFRPRHRPDNVNPDLLALKHATHRLLQNAPEQAWVFRLNQFMVETRHRVFEGGFAFKSPAIIPMLKPGKKHEYRALCRFELQDNVIISLFAQYLRDTFDPAFSACSFAFRGCDGQGHTPNHHDAFDHLFHLQQHPNHEFYVAECDIRGFFDTVDHSLALNAFDRVSLACSVHPRARQIFEAYLSCYNFQDNVLAQAEPGLKRRDGRGCFSWPGKDLNGVKSRKLGVPQGGAISGVIANLILDEADKRIESKRCELALDLQYIRYCDDMVLLSHNKQHCQIAFDTYQETVKELLLLVHEPKKTVVYGAKHWERKSKYPYLWSGRKWFGCVPWIQFVGYQIRYDGLVRPRNGSFQKQKEAFVKMTGEAKNRLLEASRTEPIRASRNETLRSLSYKLSAKGVGFIQEYVSGPRPMSWCNGFRSLNEKPMVISGLKALDRIRQKLIISFADKPIKYGNGKKGWEAQFVPLTHHHSYVAQFKNRGGMELINNPWRASNWREWVMAKIFIAAKNVLSSKDWFGLKLKILKKKTSRFLQAKAKVGKGEMWRDNKYRRTDKIYEILEVNAGLVKCRNLSDHQIRHIPRHLFSKDTQRLTQLTDSERRFLKSV